MLLQVESLWENACTHERLLSGARLHPLAQTPWQFFVPSGVDRASCLVLSREVHTVALAVVAARVVVAFQKLGSSEEEARLQAALSAEPGARVCHLQVTAGGGVDNIDV
jgi:hypothetical protein